MMKLVEQYLYAVSKYLPEKNRRDVTSELRTNIEDMLPESYKEEDVRAVLTDLGDPRELAYKYDLNRRYLIGPHYYDQYIKVLKLVIGIAVSVLGTIVIISWAVDPSIVVEDAGDGVSSAVTFIAALFSAVLEGIIQAALWVTVIFVILERSGVALDESKTGRDWTPDDLKDVPSSQAEIPRSGIVASMLFTILFLAVLWFRPEIIGLFETAEEGIIRTPLFDIERLKIYLPLVIGITVFEIGILSWKYVSGRWTRPLALANTLCNVLVIITSFIMLRDQSLFNPELPRQIANIFSLSVESVRANIERTFMIVLWGIVLLSVWDSFDGFRRAGRK